MRVSAGEKWKKLVWIQSVLHAGGRGVWEECDEMEKCVWGVGGVEEVSGRSMGEEYGGDGGEVRRKWCVGVRCTEVSVGKEWVSGWHKLVGLD